MDSNIMFSNTEFDFQMRIDKTQPVFQMLFYASKSVTKSTRRYQKLPEILGSVAGMIQFIMFICSLVTNLVTYVSTLKYIVNNLYLFPNIIEENLKRTHKKTRGISSYFTKIKRKFGKGKKKTTLGFENPIQTGLAISARDPPPVNKGLEMPAADIQISIPNHITSSVSFRQDPLIPNTVFHSKVSNFHLAISNQTNIVCGKYENKSSDPNQIIMVKDLKEDSFCLEHFSEEKEQSSLPKEDLQTGRNNQKILTSSNIEDLKTKMDEKTKKMNRLNSFLKKKTVVNLMDSEQFHKNHLKLSCIQYLYFILRNLFFSEKPLKHQLISKAEHAYQKDLDIVNIDCYKTS